MPRVVFAVLCLVGLIAILCGALFEFGRQKRAATISSRHFRWRMVSALLWVIILGSLAYATIFLWPVPPTQQTVRRFGAVLAGSMSLMLLAFVLMLFDFYLTSKTRQAQSARMRLEMAEIARIEIERAQQRANGNRSVERQPEGGETS